MTLTCSLPVLVVELATVSSTKSKMPSPFAVVEHEQVQVACRGRRSDLQQSRILHSHRELVARGAWIIRVILDSAGVS